jgi:hypothetical protein
VIAKRPRLPLLLSLPEIERWRRDVDPNSRRAGPALEIDPTNFNHQYAAIGDVRTGVFNDSPGSALNGVYRSLDGGQTRTVIPGPWGASTPSYAGTGRIELAIAPSN